MENKKKIAIIGGGYSGLSSGIYAQLAGFQTKIFEHAQKPGGLAASFKKGDYTFDLGTHFMMGYRPGKGGIHKLLEPLGIGNQELYVPMTNFAHYIDEIDNVKVDMNIDLDKVQKDLLVLSPHEEKEITDFINVVKAFRDGYQLGMDAIGPPEKRGIFEKLKFFWNIKSVIFYMGGSRAKTVDEFCSKIKTRWLRDFIRSLFINDIAMYYLYIILGVFSCGQIGFIKDGCETVINAMVEKYKSLGGEIQCNSTVTKVIVKDGKAVGVKLENGEEYLSDYVISGGDLTNTIKNLLENKFTTPEIQKRIDMRVARPFFFATYGVKKDFKNAPSIVNIVLKKPIKYGEHKIEMMNIRFLNYGNFAPKGKTVIQGLYFSECGYWETLHEKDVKEYEKEKKRVADEMLERIEEHYPGVKENIEVEDIATPYTTIKFTMHKYGTWGGCQVNDEIIKNKLNHTIPGLKNFYMVGNWIYSGGLSPTFNSSKNAIDLILEGY